MDANQAGLLPRQPEHRNAHCVSLLPKDARFRKMMLGLQSKDNKSDLSTKKLIVEPFEIPNMPQSHVLSFLPGGTHERAKDILQKAEDQSIELSEQKKIEWQGGYIWDVWTEELQGRSKLVDRMIQPWPRKCFAI